MSLKSDVLVVNKNNDGFLTHGCIDISVKRHIKYILVKYKKNLYLFGVKRREKKQTILEKIDFLTIPHNYEINNINSGESNMLELLKFITKNNNILKYVKNNSNFLKSKGIKVEILPVFDNYSDLDDNIDYFLKSFKTSIVRDEKHPLRLKFEKTFCELLQLKGRELIKNQLFADFETLIKENKKFFKIEPRLSFLEALFMYNKNELYLAAELLFEQEESGKINGEGLVLLSRILDEIDKTEEALKIIEENIVFCEDDNVFLLEYLRILLKLEMVEKMGQKLKEYEKKVIKNRDIAPYFNYYKGLYFMITGNMQKAKNIFEDIKGTIVDDMYLRLNLLQIYKIMDEKRNFLEEKDNILKKYNNLSSEIKSRIESWTSELNEESEEGDEEDYKIMKQKAAGKKESDLNIKKALEEAEKFTADNPENPWGFYSLGSLYLKLGGLEKAKESFIKSLDILGNNGIVYHGLGIVYSKLNKNTKAIECFKEAIISKPEKEMQKIYTKWNYSPELAYFSLADAYIKLKKIDEAILVLTKGLEFDASSFMPHFQLGTCYEFKKEYFKALESYFNVKKLNKSFNLVDFYIGNCYVVLEDFKKAKKHLKLYLDNDKDLIYKKFAKELIKKISNKLD
ncbi:MAG: hypothetical protein ACQESP_01575 [Candidatus Muiribacteriota bacterium]